MILVDTSVWIEHLRSKEEAIVSLLENELVGIHPFVIGELACGAIKNRGLILELLDDLPKFPIASDNEVRELIESRRLYNRGIGWVDAHLLASVQLHPKSTLITLDNRLALIAEELS